MRAPFLLGLFGCILLTGCTSSPKPDLQRFNTGEIAPYPPISVVVLNEELDTWMFRDALMQAIADANLFEYVTPSGKTRLLIEVSMKIEGGHPAGEAAKIFTSGVTLGLAPMKFTYQISGTARFRYDGEVFEEFPYSTEFSSVLTLASVNAEDAGLRGAVRKAVESILDELETRRSIPRLLQQVAPSAPQLPVAPPNGVNAL